MSVHPEPLQESCFFQLMLIDEDPVFRLGLRIWLEQIPDLALVAEAETGATALQILEADFAGRANSSPEAASSGVGIDLVILDVGLGRSNPNQIQGLSLCQRLKAQYPNLPVLLLSSSPEPVILAAAQQAGANGYCPKEADVTDLVAVMRRVAAGQTCWMQPDMRVRAAPLAAPLPAQSRQPNPLSILRRNLRLSGTRQIDAALGEVTIALQDLDLPLLDRAILAGRQRELRVSRWLVNRFLATPTLPEPEQTRQRASEPGRQSGFPVSPAVNSSNSRVSGGPVPPSNQALSTVSESSIFSPQPISEVTIVDIRGLQEVLFEAVWTKLQGSLENQSELPLETDVLREEKKRELFDLILRKFEELLNELRYSEVEPEQLPQKRSLILQDLWQTTTVDFFGKYYTVRLRDLDVEVVNVVLQDAGVVQAEILDKIPAVVDLLMHLLFQAPLIVDSTRYPPGNPESLARAELILENLIIQIANAVMQPLLNRFANVEVIKQNFYDRHLLSSREVERFRNNLSWKYRLERYIREPKDIFESQYQMLTFAGRGIKKVAIYAPRNQELEELSGVQFAVTLALETRDAIAPRIRATISFLGNGLIYVLTDVVGRGIGLIGRGVLKGIGNAWQDNRFNRR